MLTQASRLTGHAPSDREEFAAFAGDICTPHLSFGYWMEEGGGVGGFLEVNGRTLERTVNAK